ncbi:SNARE domain-containing protein [Cryptosporidium muris RN66]|uniref:SNARE domain-containing protein n=1 Tax=Cryptosporidium muris (strain RN66) TaxID=441375 RepID=B6ADZ0_CRYMR|nr:SNARE domain-containing protein [Cryptosporidium muris RN66]EEA06431.1 SNARE domain-containing protein [Cryptosporidium muris RN66]|eukprot:XP_002140780.1 SNARE domain-containing protein [Cryptosporidium muris RN66]
MIDLLGDLHEYTRSRYPDIQLSSYIDLEKGNTASGEHKDLDDAGSETSDGMMSKYYYEIQSIGESLASIQSKIDEIRHLKQEALITTNSQKDEEISQRLTTILDQAHENTLELKNYIEKLRQQNEQYKKSAGRKETSEIRIRENLLQAITKRFRETLTDFQTVQMDYKAEMKNKMARQIKILIKMKLSGSHETLNHAIADLQDKYRDIRRLERSVEELHQLFIELASLINTQGELLDHIEFSVSNAKEYTEKVEIELIQARKYQKSYRKKMMWIIICICILITVIILPIVLGVTLTVHKDVSNH